MQKLLLSAKDLVKLSLAAIPHPGYISPDAMVTAISVMTRLKSLRLEFYTFLSRPDPGRQLSAPLTRTVLPALTTLAFQGIHEYSESLMAQIDAPLLEGLFVSFIKSTDLTVGVPQLYRFVSQTEAFKTHRRAQMSGSCEKIVCALFQRTDPVE